RIRQSPRTGNSGLLGSTATTRRERASHHAYLSLNDAGSIGEDVAVVSALHSTKTVRRLEFEPAGFTALTMGAQAEGRLSRSLRASSDRETSSANSWTDASSVRTRARTPTATPLATLINNIGAPLRCVHRLV